MASVCLNMEKTQYRLSIVDQNGIKTRHLIYNRVTPGKLTVNLKHPKMTAYLTHHAKQHSAGPHAPQSPVAEWGLWLCHYQQQSIKPQTQPEKRLKIEIHTAFHRMYVAYSPLQS